VKKLKKPDMNKDKPPKDTSNGCKKSSKGCDCTEKVFDEFLEDIENDMKMERYQQLLKRYKKPISAVTTLVVGSVIFAAAWQNHDNDKREKLSASLLSAINMMENNTTDEGFENSIGLMAHIAGQNQKTYTVLGQMLQAGALANKDSKKNAPEIQKIYMSVMQGKAPGYIKELASVLYVNSKLQEHAEIDAILGKQLLEILKKYSVSKSGFALLEKESEGLILFKLGDFVAARKVYDEISKNENTPRGMHTRVSVMIQAIQDQEPSSTPS
jgi:hypothetical protein